MPACGEPQGQQRATRTALGFSQRTARYAAIRSRTLGKLRRRMQAIPARGERRVAAWLVWEARRPGPAMVA
jgi:hypothetical protein